jgi:1,4-alpha-glucan branching enzyme
MKPFSMLSPDDLHLFNEGTHYRLYEKLGSHPCRVDGMDGTYFAVWAPNAEQIHVIGDFNDWNSADAALAPRADSGIWEGFIPGVGQGALYKYRVFSRFSGYRADKSDPFAKATELPPSTASKVWDLEYQWNDGEWMNHRGRRQSLDRPISIYEVHLGSWKRVPEEDFRFLSYRELAPQLAEHVHYMGFSHVEFLPVMEHPFYGSWGYQTTAYFAPTSRYGTPQDFMFLIDYLHQNGIGVILDWVPSHFPTDECGLGYFDGTHLYEHADPRRGKHRDWDTLAFNYGRHEIRSFLGSSALFWLDKYHADGFRIDAVASMLYLDYSRSEGEWVPNQYGGREDLEAIAFLRDMTTEIYEQYPDVQTFAEESTAWPMVSRPTYVGGLGFGLKWDMGWMHDTLSYMSKDPIYRRFQHNQLTFRGMYAFTENFVLPLSHDEVVHGKGSLLGKMPGDDWQKFANLRLLLGFMYTMTGKKLLFMGGEFGQGSEWSHDQSLGWHCLERPLNQGLLHWVRDLNHCYQAEPALYESDCQPPGFQWIDCHDADSSVLSFSRAAQTRDTRVIVACNFTPIPRQNYRIGAERDGYWREILNSDAPAYGGSGQGNLGGVESIPVPMHGRLQSLTLTLPPLAVLVLRHEGQGV